MIVVFFMITKETERRAWRKLPLETAKTGSVHLETLDLGREWSLAFIKFLAEQGCLHEGYAKSTES